MKRLLFYSITLAALGNSATSEAKPLELTWDSSGYFRSRAVTLTNLAPTDPIFIGTAGDNYEIPEIRRTSYMTTRLRITPTLRWGDTAALHFQIDALDDVLWGDNNGLSAAPLFATNTTDQHYLGGEQDALRLHKAWVQFKVPVGIVRVGRMPSHWGMGILANGGGNANWDPDPDRPKHIAKRKSLDTYFDDDFGDNHGGVVADRVLFLTKPFSIAKTIAKKDDTSSKFIMGYAYDKISEAPLLSAESASSRRRPLGQQGFISRPGDDVNEHVAFALWNDPYAQFGGPWARDTDELRLGSYFVWRHSERGSTNPSDLDPAVKDTGSDVFIADLWGRLRYGPLYAETEVLTIFGDTFGGIPFPAKNEEKEANIQGGVVRVGYFGIDEDSAPKYDATFELGHASGDENISDREFKQRPLHSDFNVGLIMFDQTLRELSARTYGPNFASAENPDGAVGFFSKGGVINANYIHPKFRYHIPSKNLTFVSSLLMAWVDNMPTTGPAMFFDDESGPFLGTEVDFALKAQFSGKMHLSIETGYLHFGEALQQALPNANGSFTLQSRIAFLW